MTLLFSRCIPLRNVAPGKGHSACGPTLCWLLSGASVASETSPKSPKEAGEARTGACRRCDTSHLNVVGDGPTVGGAVPSCMGTCYDSGATSQDVLEACQSISITVAALERSAVPWTERQLYAVAAGGRHVTGNTLLGKAECPSVSAQDLWAPHELALADYSFGAGRKFVVSWSPRNEGSIWTRWSA